jgi:hypothetical protein
MDRRAFVRVAIAGAASPLLGRLAHAQPVSKVQNVVLVHGLFADGSCWSEVIARLQGRGLSTEDRTINPDLQRFMAKRMNAKTIEVKSSHLSLISHPDAIANLILEAAGQG